MAEKRDLPVATSRESQDICFLSETNQADFLKKEIGRELAGGEVVNLGGQVIGQHQGLPLYTIGQRTGFKITNPDYQRAQKGKMGIHYVLAKNLRTNQLVVGNTNQLKKKDFWVKKLFWVYPEAKELLKSLNLKVKIRSAGRLLEVSRAKQEKGRIRIQLRQPELGVALGQSAVFYHPFGDDFEVLGGGQITD